ncbi:hypothetical protein DACRYDRAFT_105243 [Dacryopinax primogenitus]|uniref:Uncharacterized protein n=1 Tax=Dacryopinax primogenitus (strain DJM 731) TaxID=1858805 RepID=M5G638_DACPD|nr:uncharacterized protein DACRYDRAFT_105243 [Dacryopinax primogenitus]EJU04174.1 hypothetical protein DACRYDRAFT_105243 [Dacryopinax primogenitus]
MQEHDRINLVRLVRRLELPANQPSTSEQDAYTAWLQAKSQLQKVANARSLWKNLTSDGQTLNLDDLDARIDKLEKLAAKSVDEHPAPLPPRTSFLELLPTPKPLLPISILPPPEALSVQTSAAADTTAELTTSEPLESSLLPSEPLLPEFSFLLQPSSKKDKEPEAEYQLNAIQQELADQLAHMGHQLKLNAINFGERLAADVGVVKEAEEKLTGNLDKMKTERGRLRDYSSTARGTTCLVITCILVVIIAWVMMFVVIRIT